MKWLVTLCGLCLGAMAVHADDAARRSDVQDANLQRELLQRITIDQDARTAFTDFMNKHATHGKLDTNQLTAELKAEFEKISAAMKKADSENTGWLKELVADRGWPTRTLVGIDGAHSAWLLVQHADADLTFQRTCLDQMIALPKGEVAPTDIAYLTDRVLLAEGKKQMYGTQFSTVDGKLQPRPIEDEAHVDQLRAEVGLPPLAEYAKQIEKLYGGS